MQLKPITAIIVLLLVAVSLAGCMDQQVTQVHPTWTVSNSPINSPPTLKNRSITPITSICDVDVKNRTWLWFVINTTFELADRFGNSSNNMKLASTPQLDNTTWRFNGDWLIINAPGVTRPSADITNASILNLVCYGYQPTQPPLFSKSNVSDPHNFTSNSTNLTVFYLIPQTVTKYIGINRPNIAETSYYIVVVKYPEKRVIGYYSLNSPIASEETGSQKANFTEWVVNHSI